VAQVGEHAPATIRPATAHDAVAIADVHVRSWQEAYRGMMPPDYLDRLDPADRLPLWRQLLAESDRRRGDVLVAAVDDGICGFSAFGPNRDEDQDPGRVAEVGAIYLAPGAMGQGVGRALMTASLDRLTRMGYEQVTLWVLDVNERARRFYETAGFRPDGGSKADDREELNLAELRYRRPLA
jgi:ribosomal protein S18 acetylase RimI-like enzyme